METINTQPENETRIEKMNIIFMKMKQELKKQMLLVLFKNNPWHVATCNFLTKEIEELNISQIESKVSS